MFILRLIGLICLVGWAVCIGTYLLTNDRRYLHWGRYIFRIGLGLVLVFVALLVLERLAGGIL